MASGSGAAIVVASIVADSAWSIAERLIQLALLTLVGRLVWVRGSSFHTWLGQLWFWKRGSSESTRNPWSGTADFVPLDEVKVA